MSARRLLAMSARRLLLVMILLAEVGLIVLGVWIYWVGGGRSSETAGYPQICV